MEMGKGQGRKSILDATSARDVKNINDQDQSSREEGVLIIQR